jgi:hypothetical protein
MDDSYQAQSETRATVDSPNARGVQIGDNSRQYNYFGVPAPVEDADQANAGTSRIGFVALAIVVLVVYGCYNLFRGSSEVKSSFPIENGQRPAGSSDQAVLGAALGALNACAKVVALKPVNCPQIVDDFYTEDAVQVAWRLHGDPGDGARVVFNGEEGRFHVLGTAVMTVSYKDGQGPRLRLRVVQYWSRVEWAGSQPKVAEIRAYDDTPKPSTEKRNPNLPDNMVFPLVENAFQRCASARSAPMPPECPSSKNPITVDKAEWKLNGNPLVNARATFDVQSGLIHVKGNYSATVAYKVWLSGATSRTDSGTYDAVISIDNGKPTVLRIQSS